MTLEKLHGDPFMTNAQQNRNSAMRMFKAGMTPRQIAKEFGRVFKVEVEDGTPKLGQKYDSIYPDGRKETKFTINRGAVSEAIERHTV